MGVGSPESIPGIQENAGLEGGQISVASPKSLNESFNGKLRDELSNREIFYTLEEAKVLIEDWRREYNTIRPHSSLGYSPPAPEALACVTGGGLD